MSESGDVSGCGGSVRRLGVIGGTFDPPHYAHLVLAETARVQLQLDQVLFVPAQQPPHKVTQAMSSARHRTAMVEAAIAGNPAFSLSRVDLDRSGPSYTAGMLALLHQAFPAAELFFLMGGDSLAELHTWHDPGGVVRHAHLAVMHRSGWEVDLVKLEQVVPRIGERLLWLDVPRLDISSTDLRRRVRQGLPIRYLVPSAVDGYIRDHRLHIGEDE